MSTVKVSRYSTFPVGDILSKHIIPLGRGVRIQSTAPVTLPQGFLDTILRRLYVFASSNNSKIGYREALNEVPVSGLVSARTLAQDAKDSLAVCMAQGLLQT